MLISGTFRSPAQNEIQSFQLKKYQLSIMKSRLVGSNETTVCNRKNTAKNRFPTECSNRRQFRKYCIYTVWYSIETEIFVNFVQLSIAVCMSHVFITSKQSQGKKAVKTSKPLC